MPLHFNCTPDKLKRQRLRNRIPPAERRLWQHLRRRHIAGAKFRRQYGIDRFVVDFYCPELKLAIEIDGPTHHSPEAQAYDKARQQHIEAFGIEFLRFSNAQVYQELDFVVNAIRQRVLELRAGADPS